MNCPQIHVSSDAGVSTYMYEFRYRPSFVSDKRPQTVEGDHGDEIFSVFGIPLLKGIGSCQGALWETEGLGSLVSVWEPSASFWHSLAELNFIRQSSNFLMFYHTKR